MIADGAAALAAGTILGGIRSRCAWGRPAVDLTYPRASQAQALRALGRSSLRLPDSLPAAAVAAGTDTMPEVEHVVVLMLENHSYDNLFGMLGRGRHQRRRGDGFTIAADGHPTASNPYSNGRRLRAFRMPTTCQLEGKPSQEWEQSHIQFAGGRNDGFVISNSGPVAMGYWTGQDLPFTYDLATRFPIGDRRFSNALAQTDPNRRFLIAATSSGMTDDIGGSPGNLVPDTSLPAPSNGTIFERLSAAGVSWNDYCQVPSVIVSPYAKRDHVSHVVYDHTSILALLERKWNLPAMTYRDANANDLTDFLDLQAMAARAPTFPELPSLAPAGDNAATLACSKTGPGQIPPAAPGPARSPRIRLELRDLGIRRHLHGLLLELRTSHGTLTGLEIELHHGKRRVARHHLQRVAHAERRVILRVHRRAPRRGHYTVIVRHRHRILLHRRIRVR